MVDIEKLKHRLYSEEFSENLRELFDLLTNHRETYMCLINILNCASKDDYEDMIRAYKVLDDVMKVVPECCYRIQDKLYKASGEYFEQVMKNSFFISSCINISENFDDLLDNVIKMVLYSTMINIGYDTTSKLKF